MGAGRNLTAGEMVDQVLTARELAPGNRLTHVVVMGMGEPFLNYRALVKSLRLIHEELGLSYRHLTVSTAGNSPGIRKLAVEGLPVAGIIENLYEIDRGITQMLIHHELRPLVVTCDHKVEYFAGLEAADAGDLLPLVKLFARLPRVQFRRGMRISEKILDRHGGGTLLPAFGEIWAFTAPLRIRIPMIKLGTRHRRNRCTRR